MKTREERKYGKKNRTIQRKDRKKSKKEIKKK